MLTGAARHQADPDAVQDAPNWPGLTTFLGIAAAISGFVAVTVIASAFGLSVAQRRRDLALLRTIGATPRRSRGWCGPRRPWSAWPVPPSAACSA